MRSLIAIVLLSPLVAWADGARARFSDGERAFREAKAKLLAEYVDDKLSEEDLYRGAVRGMLAEAGGRKWDTLLSPGESADLGGDMRGEVVGIGVEIKHDEGGPTQVIGLIPGAPAEKAGLRPGDAILKIDGRSTRALGLREVAYAIRGKPGSAVKLTLLRDDAIVDKTVVREAIAWSPVSEFVLPGGLGVVRVAAFTEKTPAQLRAALERLREAHLRGLVIDLRGNEGGLFDKMLACAQLLLPKGSLVVTQLGRGGRPEAHRTSDEPIVKLPLAVLVNAATASGAEMLAGALKESGGARLVGQRTHGKWNVQRVADLPNSWAIKYTVGTFKSPRGQLLDGKGLDPDLAVDFDAAAIEKAQRLADPKLRLESDPQLRSAAALLSP